MRDTGLRGMPGVLTGKRANATSSTDERHDGLLLAEGVVCRQSHNDGIAVHECLHYNHGVLYSRSEV